MEQLQKKPKDGLRQVSDRRGLTDLRNQIKLSPKISMQDFEECESHVLLRSGIRSFSIIKYTFSGADRKSVV